MRRSGREATMVLWVTFREEKNCNDASKRCQRKVGDSDTCGKLTAILSEKVAS